MPKNLTRFGSSTVKSIDLVNRGINMLVM